jgi:hypothetical protein
MTCAVDIILLSLTDGVPSVKMPRQTSQTISNLYQKNVKLCAGI